MILEPACHPDELNLYSGQLAAVENLLSALIDCPHKLAHFLAALYAVQEGLTDAGAASQSLNGPTSSRDQPFISAPTGWRLRNRVAFFARMRANSRSIRSALAVLASSAWLFLWVVFGSAAARSGLSRSAVYSLSGAHGRSLSASEADLVQTAWVLEVTSLALVLLVAAPFFLLLERRQLNHRLRLYTRLRELGDV